jgi:hypothetical protein
MPATETLPAKRLAPLPWAPHGTRYRCAPFSCTAGHENHGPRSVRERAQRWDVPLLENVLLAPRSRVGTFSRVAILGRRVTEKCVTATEKAVETPGGGRSRPRMTNAPRHRRAASRSGGATSAERDGRPVSRRTVLRGATAERGPPEHRPSVTFGFASAPARRPSATSHGIVGGRLAVASGRLGGLPRPRYTLLRHALPEDCQSRGCAHQMRDAVGTTSRMARPTGTPLLLRCGARESRVPLST